MTRMSIDEFMARGTDGASAPSQSMSLDAFMSRSAQPSSIAPLTDDELLEMDMRTYVPPGLSAEQLAGVDQERFGARPGRLNAGISTENPAEVRQQLQNLEDAADDRAASKALMRHGEFGGPDYLASDEEQMGKLLGTPFIYTPEYKRLTPKQKRLANKKLLEAQKNFDPSIEAAALDIHKRGLDESPATRIGYQAAASIGNTLKGLGNNLFPGPGQESTDQATRSTLANEAQMSAIRQAMGRQQGGLERIVGGAFDSLAKSAGAATVGGLAGGPLGAVAAMATTFANDSYNQSYAEAIKNGAGPEDADRIAKGHAALEVGPMLLFQAAGVGGLEKILAGAKWKGIKGMATSLLSELPEEELTTVSQFMLNAPLDPNQDAHQQVIDTAAQTLVTMGLANGMQAYQSFVDNPTAKRAAAAGIPPSVAPTQAARERIAQEARNAAESRTESTQEPPEITQQALETPTRHVDASLPTTTQEPPQPAGAIPVETQEAEILPPAAPVAGNGPTAVERGRESETGLTLDGMAGGLIDSFYDAIRESIKNTGKVPSAERNTNLGKAWDMLAKEGVDPETFVSTVRNAQPKTPEDWARIVHALTGTGNQPTTEAGKSPAPTAAGERKKAPTYAEMTAESDRIQKLIDDRHDELEASGIPFKKHNEDETLGKLYADRIAVEREYMDDLVDRSVSAVAAEAEVMPSLPFMDRRDPAGWAKEHLSDKEKAKELLRTKLSVGSEIYFLAEDGSRRFGDKAKTVKAIAEGLYNEWARGRNVDADGILGPASGLADSGKQELVSWFETLADRIFESVAANVAEGTGAKPVEAGKSPLSPAAKPPSDVAQNAQPVPQEQIPAIAALPPASLHPVTEPASVRPSAPAPGVEGGPQSIAGERVSLTESNSGDDGVRYELFDGPNASVIRTIDEDSGNVVEIRKYPADIASQAKVDYDNAVRLAGSDRVAKAEQATERRALQSPAISEKTPRSVPNKTPNTDRLTASTFRQQLASTATSPEEADALYGLVEARAEAAGESVDDYVGKRFKEVKRAKHGESFILRDKKTREAYDIGNTQKEHNRLTGEVEFLKDGRAIIRGFENAQNSSTLAHELGHVFRRDLKAADLDVASKWAGAKNSKKWNRDAEEKFARGFEKFLRDGKAPTPRLRRIFQQFKDWLGAVYKSLRGSPINVKIPADMQGVYARLFTTPNDVAQRTSPARIEEVMREYDRMRAAEPDSAAFYDEVSRLPIDDQVDIYEGAKDQADTVNEYLYGVLRDYDSLLGGTSKDVISYVTKAGKRRTRKVSDSGNLSAKARMIASRGGDADKIPGFDQYVESLRSGDYPYLAAEASKIGDGDLESGLFEIIQGGKVQFEEKLDGPENWLSQVLEQYHDSQKRTAETDGAGAGWPSEWDDVEGSSDEGGFEPEETTQADEDFRLENAPPTPRPAEFDDTRGRQQAFITGRGKDLPGQDTLFDPDGTSDVLFQESTDRFRGLANHARDMAAREANYRVDEELGYPETRSRTVAEQEAAKRLATDPAGTLAGFVQRIDEAEKVGGTLDLSDEADTVTLARLAEQAAIEGYQKGDPAARTLHRKLQRAFRQARTEQARSLGFRDPTTVARRSETPEERGKRQISEAMSEPTPQEKEAIRAAKTPEERAAVEQQQEERYQKLKKQLTLDGIDIDDLDSVVKDRGKVTRALNRIKDNGKFSDKAFEYWRNAIMSAISTHITNASQVAFAGYHMTVERAAETAVNLFARDPKGAQLGEWKYALQAALPGIARGARNALTSWRSETSVLSEQLNRDPAYRVDGPRGAIQGRKGRLIRAMGYRPALFVDEFVSSVVAQVEAATHAYRIAKAEGAEDIGARVKQLVDDTESAAWDAAYAKSEELGFRGSRGIVANTLAKTVDAIRNAPIPGGRWILPFRDTPAGVFEEGLKRTPILGAILDYAEHRRSGMGMADAGMTPTLARQIIALGGMTALLALNDPDDPWITGAADLADPKRRNLALRAGPPPQSIKLGGKWHDYSRIEPFSTALAWTVDAANGLKEGRPIGALRDSTIEQLKTKTYLDGLGDVITAIESLGDREAKAGMEWLSKFTASWVPNMYRRTVGSVRGYVPDRKVWGKEDELLSRIFKRTLQQAEIPGVEDLPRYDVWGKELYYNTPTENSVTDFFWNLASPVRYRDLSGVKRADLALAKWNRMHPESTISFEVPPRYVYKKEEIQYLTDQQYHDYSKLSGEVASQLADFLDIDAEHPTEESLGKIGDMIGEARKIARKELMPQWDGTAKEPPKSVDELVADKKRLYAMSQAKRAILGLGKPVSDSGDQKLEGRLVEWQADRDYSINWLKEHRDDPTVKKALEDLLASRTYRDAMRSEAAPASKPYGTYQQRRARWEARRMRQADIANVINELTGSAQ